MLKRLLLGVFNECDHTVAILASLLDVTIPLLCIFGGSMMPLIYLFSFLYKFDFSFYYPLLGLLFILIGFKILELHNIGETKFKEKYKLDDRHLR
ncbi:MAG: hypothetical protein Q7S66_02095 [bacterium]|nr:hypothetical protein [bacterium]